MSFLHLFTHFDKKQIKKHRNEIKHKQRNFIFFEFCEYYFAGLHLGIPESLKGCVFSTQLLRTIYISWHKIKVQKNQNTIVNSRFFLNFYNFFFDGPKQELGS